MNAVFLAALAVVFAQGLVGRDKAKPVAVVFVVGIAALAIATLVHP